jgi:hypothetical protein
MSQFSGQKWEYRNNNNQVGDLAPVACYFVSVNDLTPATPETGKYIATGFVEVAGQDEVPDDNYYNGIRRETQVKGPVVSRNRSVVIDDKPVLVRVAR